jgi:hypothetical protein
MLNAAPLALLRGQCRTLEHFSGEVPGALSAPYIKMGGKAAWAVRGRKCDKSGIWSGFRFNLIGNRSTQKKEERIDRSSSCRPLLGGGLALNLRC